MNGLPDKIISFAEFELDTVHRRLSRGGETIALHAKAFDLLTFLVQNNGRIISKDEILDAVWEDSFVEESNLVVQISNLRKVLGETKNAPRFLVTVPGKGYKFAADTSENILTVETHTVAELTIEHEEEVEREEIGFENRRLSERNNWSRKRFSIVGIVSLVVLTIGAIGYFRFQKSPERENFAVGWTNPSLRASPRQLTANGKINVAAISPDGTLYAYTNEGSELAGLWTAGVGGSQTVEVVPPSAINFYGLTFSPDGLFIYYAARDAKNPSGALFRVPALGGMTEKILTNINCPVTFSPDGKKIAFVRNDSQRNLSAMIVADANGGGEKEIAVRPKENPFHENGTSWLPDGTKIAVSGKDENSDENVVLLVDTKTGNAEKFGEKSWNFVRRVEWLPDGSGLFLNVIEKEFWQERQIWMLEYPNGQAHKITNDLNRYGRETVSVSADGAKLLGVRAQTVSNISVGDANDLKRLNKITDNAVGKNDGQFNGLTWTPDGRLVFMRFFDKSDTLWVMNADGSNARQLTPSGFLDLKPAVTTDNQFVFFYSNRGGGYNIWRVNLGGGDLKQITVDGGIAPSVTPDGKWVFYQKENRIWKISSEGDSQPVLMTNKPSRGIEVSPDGKKFASFYRPAKDDKLKLAVFSIEGGEPIYLFDAAADLLYEKLRWSPDGQSLVYAFYNSTAWRQSLLGGAPEKFLEFAGENINAFAWSFDGKKFAVAHGQELRDVVLFTTAQ